MRLTNFDMHNNYYVPRKNFNLNVTIDDYCYSNVVDKLGQLEDIEESTNIPFAKISSLRAGDIVYFKRVTFSEGKIFSINYENLTITVLDKEGTFIDFMLFHQYGKNRNTPLHCWFGAWALTKEELK